MSNDRYNQLHDHAAPTSPSPPPSPLGGRNLDTWLLASVDRYARIHAWQPLNATQASAEEIEEALAALLSLPEWQQVESREGPQSGDSELVWRAQWVTLGRANDKAATSGQGDGIDIELLLSPTEPVDPELAYRLIHLETYDLISGDVTAWLNRCPDIVIGRDALGSMLFLNSSGAALRNEALIRHIADMPRVDRGNERHMDEIRLQLPGEKPRYFQRTLMPSPYDMSIEDFVLAHEITARKEMEHALGDNEQLMRMLIDATPDFIAIKDGDGRWLLANDAGLRLYHLYDRPWWGKTDRELAELTHPMYADSFRACSASDEAAWAKGETSRDIETVTLPDGGTRSFDTIKMPVFDQERQRKVLIIIGRDITERQAAEGLYRRLATHDELTGLLNRRFFQEEAERLIAANNDAGTGHALILLDLDQFKTINDRYSHDRGDWLLTRVAERLERYGRDQHVRLIARMGGDEFALLIPAEDRTADDEALDEQIRAIADLIKEPLKLDGITLSISTSAGIARAPRDGDRIVTLLRAADSALYEAKSLGRDKHAYYSQEIAEKQAWKSDMLSALKTGLQEQRFLLHYQVQQNARSLAITGVEALLRWSPADQALMAGPDRFIPLLEESGHIIEVGNWVLRTACQQAVFWARQLGERITMAVNVSSLQLHAPGFIAQVESALAESGIDPAQLELELTESALVSDPDKAATTLSTLKAMGVKLALDDFGTGYSSLSYLTRFSFDRLKIDKSFVADLLTDPNDLEVVKAIIAMGHALDLDVIAEGVERVTERDLLESLGCDYFQGYLVGRPGVPEQISPMLGVGLL